MALNTEYIITLQQLKGIGTKTILDLAQSLDYDINSLEDLCKLWSSLKGKKFEKISNDDIYLANQAANRIINANQRNGIGIISYFEPHFPEILKHCINEEGKEEPVIVLYYRGSLEALNKPGIAIIGTREPTPNGVKAGEFFAGEFAKENFNIVSGLAIGCDTTAHRGALDVGGTTTAFLANGLDWDSIYPKENLELAKEIVDKGGILLSEYSVGQSCNRYALVARDRLQAALSYATIVVQTGIKGGTMHAVNATLQSKKVLFAVEYRKQEDCNNDKTKGNFELINTGKAIPLGSDSIVSAIQKIDYAIEKKQSALNSIGTLF